MRALTSAVLGLTAACTAPVPEHAPRAEPEAARPSAPQASVAQWAAPGGPAGGRGPQAEAPDVTRALFVANCAQCHGEKGDGEGLTQLDRRARSFLEGGFSYGNTKEAILRSITHGIPGTPMPPFEKALSPEQCAALADYVIALGPERIVVDPSESELVVRDRPLVVYGKLPPLVEGGPEIPRGIAIGTPDGLTFEYRADDVQLVRVRAGRFVNRTDWDGRGGTGLEMLGTTIWSATGAEGSVLLEPVVIEGDAVRRLEPRRTWAAGSQTLADRAELHYSRTGGTSEAARTVVVRETMRAFRKPLGSGFEVQWLVRSDAEDAGVLLRGPSRGGPEVGHGNLWIWRGGAGEPALTVVEFPSASSGGVRLGERVYSKLQPGVEQRVHLYVFTDLAVDPTDARTRANSLVTELSR